MTEKSDAVNIVVMQVGVDGNRVVYLDSSAGLTVAKNNPTIIFR